MMVAMIIITLVMAVGMDTMEMVAVMDTTVMAAAIIALETVAVLDSIIMILLILFRVMVVVPGDNAMAAVIMALEIVAVLDTVAKAAAIIALGKVAVDSRALTDCFLSYLIVVVLDTVAKVAAIIGSAIMVVLVDMVTVVTFFAPLKLPVLISMVKGASILILAAGISSSEIYLYGFNKSDQVAFN
jgi:hypothetical protein